MTINWSDAKLLEVMDSWKSNQGIKPAVILVDETQTDADVSKDRDVCHKMQALVLEKAALQGIPVFVVKYGFEAQYDHAEPYESGVTPALDTAIPTKTLAYSKGALETDGFLNGRLKGDVNAKKITDVIIMGQSVNACCGATARGAEALGIRVHTCTRVVRGAKVQTEPPGQWDWPNGTTVYQTL